MRKTLVSVMASLSAIIALTVAANAAPYFEGTASQANASFDISKINDDYTVDSDFTSHLPLVVIDTHGKEIEILTAYADTENDFGIRKPIEGVDPYIVANLTVYDNENEMNSLTNEPTFVSDMRIHRHGNSSMDYEKGNYKINLITETGQKQKNNLLGLDKESEWILVGTQQDRSLMRNFIAYTIAKEIMPYTPDCRYCEVIFKNGDTLTYGGVFLLAENIKAGKGRVEISTDRGNGVIDGFIIRRDRRNPYDVQLETWASRNRITEGMTNHVFNLVYPKHEDAGQAVVEAIESRISKTEQVLYSDNASVFLSYPDYIDEDSFVDYFLLNEFFGNYDAGNNSTYLYLNADGKLAMGPVWDFDGILDNYQFTPFNPKHLAFCSAPWFEQLIKSDRFLQKSIARYSKLRRTVFATENIYSLINSTSEFLGAAADRDWSRWHYEASDLPDLIIPDMENEFGDIVI